MLQPTVADLELELAAFKAVSGAPALRDKLLLALAQGNPSITDAAYAVRVRVKDDFKILEKVRLKRADNRLSKVRPGEPYGVDDIRDIIGLRIVTLYRLDALTVIRQLLDLIQADGSDSIFVSDSLEEILIYGTNPQGDPQELERHLMELFKSRALGKIAKPAKQASNYTSIHIVVWAQINHGGLNIKIPVEIQVRTAFEDIWGEMEHKLKYKRERTAVPSGTANPYDSSLAHLNVLKTLVDGVSQYADQIRVQIAELDGARLRSAVTRTADDLLARLRRLRDLPADLKNAIQTAAAAARTVMHAGGSQIPGEKAKGLQVELRALEATADRLAATPGLTGKTIQETDYVISMYRALILFEIGNALEDGQAQLEQAQKIYEAMHQRFPERAVVRYRLAKVLDAAGSRLAAIDMLRALLPDLGTRRAPLPKDHWIRSAAPRVLGALLWEEADLLGRQHVASGDDSWSRKRLELLREAFEITRAAHELKVKDEGAGAAAPLPSERAKSANNLLYYALELLDALTVDPDAGVEGVSQDAVRVLLRDMGADKPGTLDDLRFVDTARKAYRHLGDTRKMRAAARRFVALADAKMAPSFIDSVHMEEMYAAARAALENQP